MGGYIIYSAYFYVGVIHEKKKGEKRLNFLHLNVFSDL